MFSGSHFEGYLIKLCEEGVVVRAEGGRGERERGGRGESGGGY